MAPSFELLESARREIERWGREEKGLGEGEIQLLKNLLDRDTLLGLPCSKKVEKRDTHEGLRQLFYHHLPGICGWRERVEEGDKGGISALLYSLVRQIWPSSHMHKKRLAVQGGRRKKSRCSSASSEEDGEVPSLPRLGLDKSTTAVLGVSIARRHQTTSTRSGGSSSCSGGQMAVRSNRAASSRNNDQTSQSLRPPAPTSSTTTTQMSHRHRAAARYTSLGIPTW